VVSYLRASHPKPCKHLSPCSVTLRVESIEQAPLKTSTEKHIIDGGLSRVYR